MFKSQNFCHIASNNRNLVKVGVFTYRTTDSLETVLTSGYFNERIIDINLHDLIIHEKISAIDSTVVERNILCVVERTLDNVGTVLIKSDWEKGIDETIEDILSQLDNFVLKTGDTMTGALNIIKSSSSNNVLLKLGNHTITTRQWNFMPAFNATSLSVYPGTSETDGYRFLTSAILPARNNDKTLGALLFRWKSIYTGIINNGGDLIVPENTSGTLATKADVDLAANSGDQLYSTGVWYAKMYAGTTPPASVEGRNYADFSQTDGSGNPVIKIYTYTSGSWTLTDTIVPPTEYNGYMTITSKIWDISEQTGQQGGKVLWSHNQRTFTPYPQIISFENAALTGVSTAPTPIDDSPDNQIATKEYVDTHSSSGGSGRNIGDIFYTKRTDTALAGAVECNGGTYNTEDYEGEGSIGELLEAGKLDYISLTDYATAISTKGWCDKIGWDGTGTTSFRVPTLTPHIVQKNNIPVDVRVPKGGQFSINNDNTNNAQKVIARGSFPYTVQADGGTTTSNTMYGVADTTDTAQLRVMFQLFNSTTDEAVATVGTVVAQVVELNSHRVVDFQIPTEENGYTWYRKYADGWVEQGGFATSQDSTVSLPITMANANYNIFALAIISGKDNNTRYPSQVYSQSTTEFSLYINVANFVKASWRVEGMAAN